MEVLRGVDVLRRCERHDARLECWLRLHVHLGKPAGHLAVGLRCRAPQTDPIFRPENRASMARLFALFERGWVRVVAILMALLLVAGTVYSKLVVEPKLTATELQVWVAGDDGRVRIGVDDEAGVVAVVGGRRGVAELFVAGQSLIVSAIDVGVEAAGVAWIEVPLSAIDPRFSALLPDRLMSAIDRGVKECSAPDADAVSILTMLFPIEQVAAPDRSLCWAAWEPVADRGRDLLVDHERVRTTEIAQPPTVDVVPLNSLVSPAVVIEALARLLVEP